MEQPNFPLEPTKRELGEMRADELLNAMREVVESRDLALLLTFEEYVVEAMRRLFLAHALK